MTTERAEDFVRALYRGTRNGRIAWESGREEGGIGATVGPLYVELSIGGRAGAVLVQIHNEDFDVIDTVRATSLPDWISISPGDDAVEPEDFLHQLLSEARDSANQVDRLVEEAIDWIDGEERPRTGWESDTPPNVGRGGRQPIDPRIGGGRGGERRSFDRPKRGSFDEDDDDPFAEE